MGKNLKKSEKLDLILAELVKIKDEIKKIQSHPVAGTVPSVRKGSEKPRAGQAKRARARANATAPESKDAAPSKPVLVAATAPTSVRAGTK